jgi:uroporphyrinogen decarboxylase
MPVILHSCGDIRKMIPMIVEAGFDCLQPMEAKAGINVVELAKEWKDKISFMGNMNVMIYETNDKAKVREEVETKVKALKQLKAAYFFHSDHSISPNVKYETYKYALEVFRENMKV